MLVYIYFNQRALSRAKAQPSASDWDGFMAHLGTIPDLGDEDATSLLMHTSKQLLQMMPDVSNPANV